MEVVRFPTLVHSKTTGNVLKNVSWYEWLLRDFYTEAPMAYMKKHLMILRKIFHKTFKTYQVAIIGLPASI